MGRRGVVGHGHRKPYVSITAFRHLEPRHAGRNNGERRMLEGSITISVSDLAPYGIVHLHPWASIQTNVLETVFWGVSGEAGPAVPQNEPVSVSQLITLGIAVAPTGSGTWPIEAR